jgi:transketolase
MICRLYGTVKNMSDSQKYSTRDGFGQGLIEAAQADSRVVGLCADLAESTKMDGFAKQFPDRFIEVGVAEQNLAGLAAGFALAGKIPFAASYACFHPANSWGVIRTSICYSNLNVKLVGGHGGLVTGPDGATHQSLEDVALMRVLPNMTVVIPCDAEEARKATLALATQHGPCYLRTNKQPVATLTTQETPFEIGKAVILQEGSDVSLIACGVMVSEALNAAQELAQKGISVRVINMHTIKPLDVESIIGAARETRAIITIEDHQVIGGLGSAVAEVLSQSGQHIPFKIMGVQDQFGESGTAAELLQKHGLTATAIITQVQAMV